MNRTAFLTRFILQPRRINSTTNQVLRAYQNRFTNAAVLIALQQHGNELSLVLTKRADHLRHHQGQISFPGGKHDITDQSLIETALREAEEEIALDRESVQVIGKLADYPTITGFKVTPVVAMIPNQVELTPNPEEVDYIFHLPLSYCLNSANFIEIPIFRKNTQYPVKYLPYKQHKIWGATAAILADLAEQIR